MKNTHYHFLIALFAIIVVSCTKDKQIEEPIPTNEFIEIPDIYFEKALILNGFDSDGVINHKILKTDAEKVERLNIISSNIADVTGIEGFINLKRLHADANVIETIDLSKNILLDTISLSSNKLTLINGLAKVKNLKWLSLSFNYFTEFTLENSSINNLLMSNNDLTIFDSSKAPKLKSALLNLNKIENLDFSNNPLLETLIFSANKIKTINLDSNVNLEYIYCSSNLLTDFDVSKLTKLVDLRIDRNPTLTCIKVAAGQNIPTLKLSSYQQAKVDCN